MGLSATQSFLGKMQAQEGIMTAQEQKNYTRLLKETQAKLGEKCTPMHLAICKLFASNLNATVKDVEDVYNQRYALGLQPGQIKFGNTQDDVKDLNQFKNALNQVPGYESVKDSITSKQMIELLGMWNLTSTTSVKGQTRTQAFIQEATKYISNLNGESKSTSEETQSDQDIKSPQIIGADIIGALNRSRLAFRIK